MVNLAQRPWRVVAVLAMATAASGCGLALEPRFYRLETRDGTVVQDGAASDSAEDGATEFPDAGVRDAIVSIDAVEDIVIVPILPDATTVEVVVHPPDAREDTGIDVRTDSGIVRDSGIALDAGMPWDTGIVRDSGIDVRTDTGIRPDTGIALDTGVRQDTGTIADTGTPMDGARDAMGLCPMPTVRCPGTTMCIDLENDRAHCGMCGAMCRAGQTCTGGRCLP